MTRADFTDAELTKLKDAASLLLAAEDRLPVLRTLAWDRSLADRFFADGERALPAPAYPVIDMAGPRENIRAARALIDGASPVHDWLRRFADATERTAALLSCVGRKEFYQHSADLFGEPASPVADGRRTALELARRLDRLLSEFDEGERRLAAPESLTASDLKRRLEDMLPRHFGDAPPRVEVTLNVSGKAAAGKDYIKLRADAAFSDLDAIQLLQHEALVHIATGRNGAAQPHFPILAESYPGNTRTQEGLAVFAEFISGALDPRRFKRLADRVIAIDMAANGADFLELYRFFRERSADDSPMEAFESARRVVRGGLVEGGAPFTKDAVYLQGLLEVHNYLRTAVKAGDASFIRLLFVGKIDLTDLEAMRVLSDAGLLAPPRFMPPWARDLRPLLSYLAYSTFLNEIDLGEVATRYTKLFER